jgi:hypothetical protein
MTKARATKPTDRSQAVKYRGVARAFLDAAEALSLVAAEDETYGNANGFQPTLKSTFGSSFHVKTKLPTKVCTFLFTKHGNS